MLFNTSKSLCKCLLFFLRPRLAGIPLLIASGASLFRKQREMTRCSQLCPGPSCRRTPPAFPGGSAVSCGKKGLPPHRQHQHQHHNRPIKPQFHCGAESRCGGQRTGFRHLDVHLVHQDPPCGTMPVPGEYLLNKRKFE